jgi:hypothetical protein
MMKSYALVARDGSVLARFERDTETTEEWLLHADGKRTPLDNYIASALVSGDSSVVETE